MSTNKTKKIMELNIITYIVESTKFNQNDIAKECSVKPSTVSGWKKGAPIIYKHRKKLFKMANLAMSEDESTKWAIIAKSETEAMGWYFYMSQHLSGLDVAGIDIFTSPYVSAPTGTRDNYEINEDSHWVDKIQRMLVSLSEAGVQLDAEKSIIPIMYENKENGPAFTDFDLLIYTYTKNCLILTDWYLKYIGSIKLTGAGLAIQYAIAKSIIEIALLHIPINLFESVNTDQVALAKKINTIKDKVEQEIREFCREVKGIGENLIIDYFDCLNLKPESLKKQIYQAEDIKSADQYLSYGERKILEGIKNNENLLKEVLKRLDGDASY
jgi:hypothetical protein